MDQTKIYLYFTKKKKLTDIFYPKKFVLRRILMRIFLRRSDFFSLLFRLLGRFHCDDAVVRRVSRRVAVYVYLHCILGCVQGMHIEILQFI